MPNSCARWPAPPVALTLLATLVLAACGPGENPDARAGLSGSAEAAATFDFEGIAHNLITRNADIREGDIVAISGSPRDIELLENIAVRVRAMGAFPLVRLTTERLTRRLFDDVPERYDSQPDAWWARTVEFIDVSIDVSFGETPALLAHVPPARFQARWEADAAARAVMAQRKVRVVEVGNGLYPTPVLAQRFGVSVDELARIFWEGVATDPELLAATGGRLKEILQRGSTVRVTHPNGTDLTLGIQGRQVFVSDGTVVPEDQAPTHVPRFVWLPAGEVYLSPVPGTAQGRFVVDRHFFDGEEIRNLALTFADGRVAGMEADSDLSAFRADYDAAPEGKDHLAAIDFGINPGISGSSIQTWVPAGMLSILIGNSTWAGGESDIAYGMPFHLPGTTVTVDDRVIVEQGVLVGAL